MLHPKCLAPLSTQAVVMKIIIRYNAFYDVHGLKVLEKCDIDWFAFDI